MMHCKILEVFVDEAEARAVAVRVLEPLRALSYEELVDRFLNNTDAFTVGGPQGEEVNVEIYGGWLRRSSRVLVVTACVDDGHLRFGLFTSEFCESFSVAAPGDKEVSRQSKPPR